jgi:hypothetical protein
VKHKATTTKKLLTIPTDALEWLNREAERNLSNANSEIIRAIRKRMDQAQREREVAG